VRGRPADQQRGARTGQGAERREGGTAAGQPVIVDRSEAAQQGEHVAAAQAVVFGDDQQVPVARAEAGVEDLHHPGATTAKFAKRTGSLAATADGQHRDLFGQRGEGFAVTLAGARQPARGQPAPGRARREYQRTMRPQLQCRGQGHRLPHIAGTAVSDRPGRTPSFHVWH
jgi:hypothetical protein